MRLRNQQKTPDSIRVGVLLVWVGFLCDFQVHI